MTDELTGAAAWIVPALLAIIASLIGMMVWFLRREIRNNDKAHGDLKNDIRTTHDRLERKIETVESDVKKLLEGNVVWITEIGRRLALIENALLSGRRDDRGA